MDNAKPVKRRIVRLPEPLWDELRGLAQSNGNSIAKEIIEAVGRSVNNRGIFRRAPKFTAFAGPIKVCLCHFSGPMHHLVKAKAEELGWTQQKLITTLVILHVQKAAALARKEQAGEHPDSVSTVLP